jgi:hypothetical protein
MMLQKSAAPAFENPRLEWLANARAAARRIAREKGTVTIDEVRECCPPPADADPRVMGAVMQPREFVLIKFVESRRKACHGRPIGLFKLRT